MASSSTIVPAGGLVLVTGVNGLVGSHITECLLKNGYRVRGTVRSEDKAAWVREVFAERYPSASLEIVLVPDVAAAGALDVAVKGVDGILHAASDMTFGADPNQAITPMLKAVRGFLEAAAREPSVKRFVLTSSNRALSNAIINTDVTIDSTWWNEGAVKTAWAPPPYEPNRIWDVYAALKTQAEQEIWKFNREEKPNFVINTVLPCFVLGPTFHPQQPGSSAKWTLDFWNDPAHSAPLQQFGPSWYIDAEDTALLHLAALSLEDVKDERLFGWAGPFNFNSWVEVFRKLAPTKPWPADDTAQGHDLCKVDTTREVELLKRLGKDGWTSFYDSVKRTCLESRIP